MFVENIFNKAMDLRPSDRALLAQKLIHSLTKEEDAIEQQWIDLAEKRFNELINGDVKPLSWQKIRNSIKKRK